MYKAAQNNDRELWREVEGDHYADSIHVTENGNIGIDVGGNVIVMPVEEWHKLASELSGSDQNSAEETQPHGGKQHTQSEIAFLKSIMETIAGLGALHNRVTLAKMVSSRITQLSDNA